MLDIGNMELEGVTKVYIDLCDVDEIKKRAGKESEALDKARKLLGGD